MLHGVGRLLTHTTDAEVPYVFGFQSVFKLQTLTNLHFGVVIGKLAKSQSFQRTLLSSVVPQISTVGSGSCR